MLTTLRKLSPFAMSLMLHLGVFALIALQFQPEAGIPLGVYKKGTSETELVEIKISSPVQVRKFSAPPALKEDVAAISKNTRPTVPQASGSSQSKTEIGHANGKVSEGLLGDSKGKIASAKERYLYELHVLIEGRKVYPVMSRRLREEGKVLIQFLVEKDGTIKDVGVKEGTSYPRLNEAARDLIAGIKKYKPLPTEIDQSDAKLEISIEYTLK